MKFMKNKKALNVMGALLAVTLMLPLSSSAGTASNSLTISQNVLGKSLTVTKVEDITLPEVVEGAGPTTGAGSFTLGGTNVTTVNLAADLGNATWIELGSYPTSATLVNNTATIVINVATIPANLAVGANSATLTLTATY